MIDVISTFSGVGGLDMGLEAAGMRVVAQCEIDAQARAVLRRHWPHAKLFEDVRDVRGSALPPARLLVGGFPCQDLSVAGKRAGLGGERSGLVFEFLRIADEVAAEGLLLENVPGLLSSNSGEDHAVLLELLTGYRPGVPEGGWRNSGICVGPKRTASWRVLDLQYFGVPQRRRRVFIVAGTGAFGRPEILLEPEGLPGDPPTGEEARQVTSAIPASGAGTSRTGNERTEASFLTLASGQANAEILEDRAPTLNLNHDGPPIAFGFKPSHYTRGKDGAPSPVYPPLSADADKGDQDPVILAFGSTLGTRGGDVHEDGTSPTVRVGSGLGIPSPPAVLAFSPLNGGRSMPVTPECPTLESGTGNKAPAILAFSSKDHGGDAEEDLSPTLRAGPHHKSHANGGVPPAVAYAFDPGQSSNKKATDQLTADGAPPLPAGQGAAGRISVAPHAAIPRRLTPRECERLMGWPDDWTAQGVDEAGNVVEMADSPRYRMCGNGVGAPVAEWIGRRILQVLTDDEPT